MKKTIAIFLFIFFAIIVAILVAGLLFYQSKNQITLPAGVNNSFSSPISGNKNNPVKSAGSSSQVLNMTEISKHNSVADCWLLINNKVYNLTSFINSHPGGVGTITNYCGKEATSAYDTKGGRGRGHSSYADSLLAQYYIGNFDQSIPKTTLQQNTQKTNTVTPPATSGDDVGGDD